MTLTIKMVDGTVLKTNHATEAQLNSAMAAQSGGLVRLPGLQFAINPALIVYVNDTDKAKED